MAAGVCSRCGGIRDRPGQRYCRECHNAYRRENRPKYRDLPDTEKVKSRCRALTRALIKRGSLVKGPCEDCGAGENIEAHHEDYSLPQLVVWLCRRCHRIVHGLAVQPVAGMTMEDVVRRFREREANEQQD